MNIDMETAKIMGLAYLLGSLPFAWIAGKLLRGIDIRRHGSGNAGATNAWRVLGPGPGLTVGALDMAKGWAAVAMAGWISDNPAVGIRLGAGLFAVAGHTWPVWLGFRGGKGVLTAGGAFLNLAWLPMACSLAVFILVFKASGYVSLGSITASAALPLFILLIRGPWHEWQILATSLAVAVFILVMHVPNIRRLLRGDEHGFKAKSGRKPGKKRGKL